MLSPDFFCYDRSPWYGDWAHEDFRRYEYEHLLTWDTRDRYHQVASDGHPSTGTLNAHAAGRMAISYASTLPSCRTDSVDTCSTCLSCALVAGTCNNTYQWEIKPFLLNVPALYVTAFCTFQHTFRIDFECVNTPVVHTLKRHKVYHTPFKDMQNPPFQRCVNGRLFILSDRNVYCYSRIYRGSVGGIRNVHSAVR